MGIHIVLKRMHLKKVAMVLVIAQPKNIIIEEIGRYICTGKTNTKYNELKIDVERLGYWKSNGAILSNKLVKLISGIIK